MEITKSVHVFPAPIPEYLERIEHELEGAVIQSALCPPNLDEAVRYSLLGGGKRLRPLLTLLCCEVCGGDIEAAMPAAGAIEMIHTYSLIHDDLPAMDDDSLRRGQPTCHVQFGEATAILAGDGLLTEAFFVLSSRIKDAEQARSCCRELAEAAGLRGMVGGQQADLEAESLDPANSSEEHLTGIHRRKTGALIRAACRMGAILGNGKPEQYEALSTYGEAIGLAFQIADDLLDRTGTEVNMGKRVAKDDEHSKLTYPGLLGLEESQARAEQLVQQANQSLAIFQQPTTALGALAEYSVSRDR